MERSDLGHDLPVGERAPTQVAHEPGVAAAARRAAEEVHGGRQRLALGVHKGAGEREGALRRGEPALQDRLGGRGPSGRGWGWKGSESARGGASREGRAHLPRRGRRPRQGTRWCRGRQACDGLLGAARHGLATALPLMASPWSARAGVLGGALGAATFAVTVSIMLALPVWEASLGGFPWINPLGSLLIKGVALLGVSLVVMGEGLSRLGASSPEQG